MLWELAEQIVCKCTARILRSENKNYMITHLWPAAAHSDPGSHALVFGTLDEVKPWLDAGHGYSLLVLGDGAALAPDAWGDHPNIAIVGHRFKFDACISGLQHTLREADKIEEGHRQILRMISLDKPLEALADEIATTYDHYVNILDSSLNVLAFSKHTSPPFDALLSEHAHGYIKPNVIQHLRDKGTLNEMNVSSRPVKVVDHPRNTYAYTAAIRIGAHLTVGHLCVFLREEENLSFAQMYYLPQTAQLLGLELQKSRFTKTNKATYFPHLLNDMLRGVEPKTFSYEDRFAAFSYQLRRWKNIIAIRLDSSISASSNIYLLAEKLQALFGHSVYMISDGFLVYLISRAEDPVPQKEQLDSWEGSLRTLGLQAGISVSFEDPVSAGIYFEQAKRALVIGPQSEPELYLHNYDRLQFHDLLSRVFPQSSLLSFCLQPLRNLLEQGGAEQHRILLDTLFCYINNNQSVVETCKKLYIHRNTLYHRLEKIQVLLNCSLDDSETIFQIALTFKIFHFLQHGRINELGSFIDPTTAD